MTYSILEIKDESETKNNVYVIVDSQSKESVVIDPGCKFNHILDVISKNHLNLKSVLLTHTHLDHVGCLSEIISNYDVNVYVSKREVEAYHFMCKGLIPFEDKMEMMHGQTKIKCIITAGHTYGSACYLLTDSLFCGDTLFIEGCGMCTSEGSSPYDMFHSINYIKNNVEDYVKIYPGHTYMELPGKTMEYVKDNNVYFALDNVDDFVSFRMRDNQNGVYNFI